MAKRSNGTLRQKHQHKHKSGSKQKGAGRVKRNLIGNDLKLWTLSPKITTYNIHLPWASFDVVIHLLTFEVYFCHHGTYLVISFFSALLRFEIKDQNWKKFVKKKGNSNQKLRCISLIIQFGVKRYIVRRHKSKSKSTCRHLTTNQNKVRSELGKYC